MSEANEAEELFPGEPALEEPAPEESASAERSEPRQPDEAEEPRQTLLVLSHFYPPDPAAVGQYMAEAAEEMASRGYRVVVLTSARGFEDPSERYPARQIRNGVEIRRLPLASFGKGSLRLRLLGALSFVAQCIIRGLFTRRLAGILVSTSPPMAPAAAIAISKLRRVPFTFWVMDINPDQAIALGKIRPNALSARLQERLMRSALRHAARVVPLDRFMRDRLEQKVGKDVLEPKTSVLPLWPLGDLEPVPHEENPFRHEHRLDGKFVVMYSGNLGVNAPLDTLLPAMLHFKEHPEIVFVFIGGGTARPRLEAFVEEHGLENVRLLPYQPLERLKYSLSAGDVHIVSMAEELVGISHPSKVYGVMKVTPRLLYIGPGESHISEIPESRERHSTIWLLDPDDQDELREGLDDLAGSEPARAPEAHQNSKCMPPTLTGEDLRDQFCNILQAIHGANHTTSSSRLGA